MAPIITLLTDFGLQDNYVASVKGIILGICPEARLVDVTHLIPPQDVRAAAFVLSCTYADFPEGAIHLAVVDPGVGTSRRALVIESQRRFFIGPDNGLFFDAILSKEASWRAFSIENHEFMRPVVSSTFHGRDVFAPVAAHLAGGVPIHRFGPSCIPAGPGWGQVIDRGETLEGEIIYIDHFGNAISNIKKEKLEAFAPSNLWTVRVGACTVRAAGAYGQKKPGESMALIGSCGHLEIAVNMGRAADLLGIRRGDPVLVSRGTLELRS
jgi:S-adenosylmethionine hydrolase